MADFKPYCAELELLREVAEEAVKCPYALLCPASSLSLELGHLANSSCVFTVV